MSPQDGAKLFLQLAGQVEAAGQSSIAGITALALDEADQLSSGTLSSGELARMDHPYATRHEGVTVPGDPAIINEQSGEFRRAWKAEKQGDTTRIVNDSPHADFLDHGTDRMISRPIAQRIEERIAGEAQQAAEKAFKRFTQ